MEEYIDKFLKDFGQDGKILQPSFDESKNIIESCCVAFSNSIVYKIEAIRKIKEINSENYHYVLQLSGGKNGIGKWSDYFDNLQKLFRQFEHVFKSAWLVEIKNDCPDDVHTIFVGIKNN